MSRFVELFDPLDFGVSEKQFKHLAGQHDQKLHGRWAGGKSGETSLIKLSGSVLMPTIQEVAKKKARELGISEEKVKAMIEKGAYHPKELDREETLKSVLSDKFPGIDHRIASMDDPDLITVAEVIKNLPETVSKHVQLQLSDKDLTTGASKFGSSGVYEPPSKTNGYIELNLQSSDARDRKAWAVAHEYGHSASIHKNGEKSRIFDPELLTLLGFGDKDSFPEGFEKARDDTGNEFATNIPRRRSDGYVPVRNSLNRYYNFQGPPAYVIRHDVTPWTRYGHSHPEEAFAEVFAGYMVSPKALKRDRLVLYNWMKENVFEGLEYEGYSEEPPKIDIWS